MNALSKTNSDLWRETKTPMPLRWMPLARVTETDLWLGLDARGVWAIGRLEGPAVVADAANLSQAWLPILESERELLTERITEAGRLHELPISIATLPIREILRLALATRRQHWTEQALNWLENCSTVNDLKELLVEVSKSSSVGQRNRHRARRILGKIRYKSGG